MANFKELSGIHARQVEKIRKKAVIAFFDCMGIDHFQSCLRLSSAYICRYLFEFLQYALVTEFPL